MKWLRTVFLLGVLFYFSESLQAQKLGYIVTHRHWDKPWQSQHGLQYDLAGVFNKLEQSPTGKKLLNFARLRAQKQGKTLLECIEVGKASYTDFVVKRNSPHTDRKIVLESQASLRRIVHDLAHELVHFVWQHHLNPYTKNTDFAHYLKNTIEGDGGEVDALMVECKVSRELHPRSWHQQYPCRHILDQHQLSRQKAQQVFYRVGEYKSFLQQQLGVQHGAFPYLSAEKPIIVAGTSHIPYPLSLLQDFQRMKAMVCRQNHSRQKGGRAVASSSLAAARELNFIEQSTEQYGCY